LVRLELEGKSCCFFVQHHGSQCFALIRISRCECCTTLINERYQYSDVGYSDQFVADWVHRGSQTCQQEGHASGVISPQLQEYIASVQHNFSAVRVMQRLTGDMTRFHHKSYTLLGNPSTSLLSAMRAHPVHSLINVPSHNPRRVRLVQDEQASVVRALTCSALDSGSDSRCRNDCFFVLHSS
jgi:hypothetical protein